MSGSKKDNVRPDNVLKTRQTSNKLSEILQMSRQSVIESRLGFFLSILHVMSKNNSLEKRNDLSSSRHSMDQLSYISIVSRSSFKGNLTQLSTSRSMHPTEVRTKDRQRRRETDSLTEQWHDNTEFQDTETLRHPCHADMLMYNCLLVSDFRYSFAPPSSVTTTVRSGFVNFGRAMMSSLVHPLRYPWSGQKILSWTLRVLHPNICFYRRKKSQDNTHSIVRHWSWTGSHSLNYYWRSTLQSSSDNMTKILDKRLT